MELPMTRCFGSALLGLLFLARPTQAQNVAEFPISPSETALAAAAEVAPELPPSVPETPTVGETSRQQQPIAEPLQPTPALRPAACTTPRAERRDTTNWYGWQTLLTDGAALMFLLALGASDRGAEDTFASASVGTYLLGGPVVHAAHGNWGRAAGSLGLRAGAPVVGVALGLELEDCHGEDFCGFRGALIGGSIGLAAAVAIDSAALARETVRETPPIVPAMGTGKNGTWFGVSGKF